MRKFLKSRVKSKENKLTKSCLGNVNKLMTSLFIWKKQACVFLLLIFGVLTVLLFPKNNIELSSADEDFVFLNNPILATAPSKKVVISVPTGMVKANPFVPYRDISGFSSGGDVPEYNLVPPPEMVNNNSDAARVMDTIVSGILYDKYSPAAIINIEGSDYLVKKGDEVNGYKVLNIAVDAVTVKLNSNVYKAGIGEILTEGVVNHNDVSNLNNKFGGVK